VDLDRSSAVTYLLRLPFKKRRERGDEGRYIMDNKKINTFILLLLFEGW